MPWTFAHPAAVLPLRRLCPARLNLAALMLGTLTPDVGYHIDAWRFATFSHTLAGTFLVCIPMGLAMLALCYAVRKPVCHLLPQPHRAALMPLAVAAVPSKAADWLIRAVSVLIGAWTHIAWDSFTHEYGWVVEHLPALRRTAFTFGDLDVQLFSILQHGSTVLGVVVLVIAYCAWIRGRAGSVLQFAREDRSRYALLASLVLVSLAIDLVLSTRAALANDGTPGLETFTFYMAVYGALVFIPLLILAALLRYRLQRPA